MTPQESFETLVLDCSSDPVINRKIGNRDKFIHTEDAFKGFDTYHSSIDRLKYVCENIIFNVYLELIEK